MLYRVLKYVTPAFILLSHPACTNGGSADKKSTIHPSMYFLMTGMSCHQSPEPFTGSISGFSADGKARPGFCPETVDGVNVVKGRCFLQPAPTSEIRNTVEQHVYYGNAEDDGLLAGFEYSEQECKRQGFFYVAENQAPAVQSPNTTSVEKPTLRYNGLYSLSKEIYQAGETVRISAGLGMEPLIYFSLKNLNGPNELRSKYNSTDKVQEVILNSHLQPGVYEVVTLQQDIGVIFHSTSDSPNYWGLGGKTGMEVLRFKVENSQTIDSNKPQITSVDLRTKTIKRGEKITGTLVVSDDLSGIIPEIQLLKISGLVFHAQNNYPIVNNDSWTFEVDSSKFIPGEYVLEDIHVSDKAGNIASNPVQIKFEVTP